jgi:hypothetical protein
LVRGLKPTNRDFSAVKSRNNHYETADRVFPSPDDRDERDRRERRIETILRTKTSTAKTDDCVVDAGR